MKIPAGIGIAIVIAIIYVGSSTDIENAQKFLEITDWDFQNENSPLFLSVMVSENIPKKLEAGYVGYGFAWLSESSEKLYGYTTNIHSNS